MLSAKTHFEQVPMATVRKILEEQIQQDLGAEPSQGAGDNVFEEQRPLEKEAPIASSQILSGERV